MSEIQKAFSKKFVYDLVGLGYCGWDYLCVVPEIPIDAKVEFVSNLGQGGGPSATATYTAQRLGAKTAFVGVVGNDEVGRNILNEFRAAGVTISGIIERVGAASGVSYCWAEQKRGHRSIAWGRGTTKPLRVKEVPVNLIQSSRVLHLDGHQTEAAIHAAHVARAAGVTVCLDAGTVVEGIEMILRNTDIVIASESFARQFTGRDAVEDQLIQLGKSGARWTVVTFGERGSVGYDGREFVKVPAFKVRVIDTTGAGDVYHGAFLRCFLKQGTLRDCMRFASGAAALKCGALGGRTAIPTLSCLEEFLKSSTK